MGVLAEIGETLVVVHGQSDQIRLKSPVAQRGALDKFAGESLAGDAGRLPGPLRALECQPGRAGRTAQRRARTPPRGRVAAGRPGRDRRRRPAAGGGRGPQGRGREAGQRRGTPDRGQHRAPGAHRRGLRRRQPTPPPWWTPPSARWSTLPNTTRSWAPPRPAWPRSASCSTTSPPNSPATRPPWTPRARNGSPRSRTAGPRWPSWSASTRRASTRCWSGPRRPGPGYDELQDDSTRIEALDAEVARAEAELRKQAAGHQQGRAPRPPRTSPPGSARS